MIYKKLLIIVTLSFLLMTISDAKTKKKTINQVYNEVRKMKIQDVELKKISDGIYPGSFTYLTSTLEVEVIIKDHEIIKISIIKGAVTKQGKKAEKIIDAVIKKQTANVDAITGATTTSKGLLKSIENALTGIGSSEIEPTYEVN